MISVAEDTDNPGLYFVECIWPGDCINFGCDWRDNGDGPAMSKSATQHIHSAHPEGSK